MKVSYHCHTSGVLHDELSVCAACQKQHLQHVEGVTARVDEGFLEEYMEVFFSASPGDRDGPYRRQRLKQASLTWLSTLGARNGFL